MRTRRGYYGWAPFRERIPARWLLARKSGNGRLHSAWIIAKMEFRFDAHH